jgi:hypothetical protein
MSKTPLSFNVNNGHPLIPRQHNYTLDRKLVSIHSEDRDYCKWPDSSHFEITLPEDMVNVQSLRLAEAGLPANFYNISKQFCNTKLLYSTPTIYQEDDETQEYCKINEPTCNIITNLDPCKKIIELCEGFYTPSQLACVLSKLFCEKGDDIKVKYNAITQKFCFISDSKFSLLFDHKIIQNIGGATCNNECNVWCQSTKWGLGSYLGFEKKTYYSNMMVCDDSYKCCSDLYISCVGVEQNVFDCSNNSIPFENYNYITAPLYPKLSGEQVIYMEVDKYNSYDELCPYPIRTNNMFGASYGGTVNSAFAKIPIVTGPTPIGTSINFDSQNNSFLAVSYHDPPIERIKKIKVKFRYHSGQLVDFKDIPFTFSIEFNCLRNDIEKSYTVSVPYLY